MTSVPNLAPEALRAESAVLRKLARSLLRDEWDDLTNDVRRKLDEALAAGCSLIHQSSAACAWFAAVSVIASERGGSAASSRAR